MKELHPEVTWKVPALFSNDYAALTLARYFSDKLERSLFQLAYGAPACAWAGGRPCRVQRTLSEEELRSYFSAYNELGIRCALTFTHPRAGERLTDPYCNLLLSLLGEYEGQAIVADGALAHHIRAIQPNVPIICSNNVVVCAQLNGFDGVMCEADYYRSLLETYDEVVIRTEAVLEGGILDELESIADRCEVLVNQPCIRGCELAAEHINQMVLAIDGNTSMPSSCIWRECHTPEEAERRGIILVPEERRLVLVEHGFTKWKLGGRLAGARMFSAKLLDAVIGGRQTREVLTGPKGTALSSKLLALPSKKHGDALTRLP